MKELKTIEDIEEDVSCVEWIKISGGLILKGILIGVVSLFYTVTSLAFGLASIFLLIGLVNYFGQDISNQTLLLNLLDQIINNVNLFLSFIFVYGFWSRWKEWK